MAHAGGARVGKLTGLVELLSEHGQAIDADLQREYGLSLNDWAAGRVSTRRLLGLVANLTPEGTAYSRALSTSAQGKPTKPKPPPDWWWTPERDFFAGIIDLLRLDMWRTADRDHRGPPPPPIPRPSRRAASVGPEIAPEDAIRLLRSVAPVSTN